MKIAVSSDHRGVRVYDTLVETLKQRGHQIVPARTCNSNSCDYPDMAYDACGKVASGQADRAILICGAGIGMSIAANKIKGIRAALVHDDIGAALSRSHNNANVLCLSAEMLGDRLLFDVVDIWLKTEFEGGRHQRRVNKIAALERGEDPAAMGE